MRFSWRWAAGAVIAAAAISSGTGGVAQDGAQPDVAVWIAADSMCNGLTGQLISPRRLDGGGNARFPVVIENRSRKPLQLWAEGGSEGDYTLTFQVTGPDHKRRQARPGVRAYTRSALTTVRLMPGEKYVREIEPFAESPRDWVGFPVAPDGRAVPATLRAVIEQHREAAPHNPELWSGHAQSRPVEVIFLRTPPPSH